MPPHTSSGVSDLNYTRSDGQRRRVSSITYDFIQQGTLANGMAEGISTSIYNGWAPGQISIEELCKQSLASRILVLFLPEVQDLAPDDHQELSYHFKIPPVFWSPVSQDASGFFGCQEIRNADGEVDVVTSQSRYLIKQPVKSTTQSYRASGKSVSYVWHKVAFFVHWTPASSSSLPPLEGPFSVHGILIENIINFYNTAVWAWRDLIREIEQNRSPIVNPQPDYATMHEIARHVIHTSETLAVALETLASLVQEHEMFFQDTRSLPAISTRSSRQTSMVFRSQISLLKCLHHRSKALEERLKNEINLAFNTVAQHDSHIAVLIGEATQRDSVAMRTIAFLGLTFLPGTFICALFSMSFFNFSPATDTEPQRWTISDQFWIYWVVAIPVTLFTVSGWILWQRTYSKKFTSSR